MTLLEGIPNDDLKERVEILKKDILKFSIDGVDAEDYDRVVSVFRTLRVIYSDELRERGEEK